MTRYFDLIERRTPESGSGQLMTAAVLSCGLCGDVIDGMGGPGNGAICENCAGPLRRGELRGCVVWEKSHD